jgi:hypothetical protein
MKTPLSLPNSFIIFALGATSMLQAGTVTTTNDDTTPGSGSLRAVLAAAVNGETIDFAPSLNGALITLTHGELPISGLEVTIDARSLPSGISISGNNASRILNISSGSNVTLNHLTFLNGREDATSPGSSGNSGAIQANGGQLNMTRCVVKGSYAKFSGGGLYLGDGIVANLDRCTISGNWGGSFGGGIYMLGAPTITITNTEVSGNRSISGGGIFALSASPTLINSTIQGNSGEGLRGELSSSLTVRNSIIWGNRTGSGSTALQQLRAGSPATANVDYSLVEGTAASLNNLNGTLTSNNPRFVVSAVPANAPTSVADLRLLAGSPSINAGNNAAISQPLDLAGLPRIQDGTGDLGAFEGGYVTFSGLYPSLLPDGDENQNGVTNYVEYASGGDPSGNSIFSVLPTISSSSGFNLLTSNQRINGLDVKTRWFTSTAMDILSWQPLNQGVNYSLDSSAISAPGIQQVVFKILDTDPARFYRQGFSTAN